jgi:hypothetical protein
MDMDQGNLLVSRKRRRSSQSRPSSPLPKGQDDGEDTDFKLAILSSLHPEKAQDVLLDYLLAYNGSVEEVSAAINAPEAATPARKRSAATGYQSSLASFAIGKDEVSHTSTTRKQLTRKGQTLHLYTPEAIE